MTFKTAVQVGPLVQLIQLYSLITLLCCCQVFTLSDLHVDVPANMSWVQLHCRRPAHTPPHVFTVFICAGDVSANMDCIRKAFEHLVDHYDAVRIARSASLLLLLLLLFLTLPYACRCASSRAITVNVVM